MTEKKSRKRNAAVMLEDEQVKAIEKEARKELTSKSQIVRKALKEYFEKRKKK